MQTVDEACLKATIEGCRTARILSEEQAGWKSQGSLQAVHNSAELQLRRHGDRPTFDL